MANYKWEVGTTFVDKALLMVQVGSGDNFRG